MPFDCSMGHNSLRRCCSASRVLQLLSTHHSRSHTLQVEIVHFLTDNDSIGEAIVTRAAALKAAAVVLAKHQRGAIAEFFMGSVTKVRVGGVPCMGWLPGIVDIGALEVWYIY